MSSAAQGLGGGSADPSAPNREGLRSPTHAHLPTHGPMCGPGHTGTAPRATCGSRGPNTPRPAAWRGLTPLIPLLRASICSATAYMTCWGGGLGGLHRSQTRLMWCTQSDAGGRRQAVKVRDAPQPCLYGGGPMEGPPPLQAPRADPQALSRRRGPHMRHQQHLLVSARESG